MRYRRSRSRQTFIRDTRRAAVIGERALHSAKLSPDARDFLLTGVVIHYNSQLEGYLKSVIQDWCVTVSTRHFNMGHLPQGVRAFLIAGTGISNGFKRMFYDGDERRLIRTIEAFMTGVDRQLVDDSAKALVRHPLILADRSFPSEDNFPVLLERLGIRVPFNRLAQIARTDVAAKLRSFQDIRNGLAHAGIPPGMSAQDVIEKTLDVERIVAWLDRLFHAHLTKYTGPNSWR